MIRITIMMASHIGTSAPWSAMALIAPIAKSPWATFDTGDVIDAGEADADQAIDAADDPSTDEKLQRVGDPLLLG
ncbi:hypothetical protein [Bradyrhizobium sp. AS23.2]|uniref:hypothetical protein n=1 Tax=Bradyrhizobium sp. AS23.2 TaxID=1680155 RepID=UPI00094058B6|nr:hypothetical protein [Bradyrhizobium sp. AS23.2]OKO74913.1 hypothetical protein AC630_26060 [Bradyrhizobium sp. AS23.2]